MTEPQALTVAALRDLPATVDVETAGRAFGIGRTLAYQLVRAAEFPCRVVKVGRVYRVVTADLHRVLHVTDQAAADQTAAA